MTYDANSLIMQTFLSFANAFSQDGPPYIYYELRHNEHSCIDYIIHHTELQCIVSFVFIIAQTLDRFPSNVGTVTEKKAAVKAIPSCLT